MCSIPETSHTNCASGLLYIIFTASHFPIQAIHLLNLSSKFILLRQTFFFYLTLPLSYKQVSSFSLTDLVFSFTVCTATCNCIFVWANILTMTVSSTSPEALWEPIVCLAYCVYLCAEHGVWQLTSTCLPAKLLQSCPTLCDPMNCSPPGSSIHGILQ